MKRLFTLPLLCALVCGVVTMFSCSNNDTSIDEPEMVAVVGGTFQMGCSGVQEGDCDDGELPVHSVTVSSFQIGKYAVTQGQWKAIMGSNPSYFKGDNLPVECVDWHSVQEFISRLNATTGKQYRLPTEAEWEYAARGGNKTQGYKYSGSNTLGDVAWFLDNSDIITHAVGTKLPNELGIYDMSGNVFERCSDWYGDYPESAQQDPVGPATGRGRVLRGGFWGASADDCYVFSRTFMDGDDDDWGDYDDNWMSGRLIGFRLAHP